MKLAICIATYKRPQSLNRLLMSLARLSCPRGASVEIRVIDNDVERSAQPEIPLRVGSLKVRYEVEPEQNIAKARNRALEMGPADWILFVDDDEVVAGDWLLRLMQAIDKRNVDAVFGKVKAVFEGNVSPWMRRGFFDKVPPQDRIPWRGGRTSNAIVKGSWFYEKGLRFDPSYGKSGSSDTKLFLDMSLAGAKLDGEPRAVVWEFVQPERSRLSWLVRRTFRTGVTYHRLCHESETRLDHHPLIIAARRGMRSAWLAFLGLPSMLVGRPQILLRSLLTGSLALGGLSAWFSPRYSRTYIEYGTKPRPQDQGHSAGTLQ